MTVKDILREWLQCHGYDGLFNPDGECGCELSDLCPCGDSCDNCEPGYKRKPHADEDPDCEFYISAERPDARIRELLKKALPAVERDALMADAIDRHQVVPAEDQAKAMKIANDATELALDVAAELGVKSGLAVGIEKNRVVKTFSVEEKTFSLDQYGQPVCPHCGESTNKSYASYKQLHCWNCGGRSKNPAEDTKCHDCKTTEAKYCWPPSTIPATAVLCDDCYRKRKAVLAKKAEEPSRG